MTYKIDYKSFDSISGRAKDNMSRLNLPIHITQNKIENKQIPTLAILEATLTFLHSKGLLTETVEIDYTQLIDDCDMPELTEK